jgi:hypothetical protein
LRRILPYLAGFFLAIGSLWINPATDERTMYGHEGPMEENLQPREVAGWPAPYLADNPHTSDNHKLGVEDNFRAGPFIATVSFWLLVSLGTARMIARMANKKPR